MEVSIKFVSPRSFLCEYFAEERGPNGVVQNFKGLFKRSFLCICSYLLFQNFKQRLKFFFGIRNDTYGSTHQSWNLEQSLVYIDRVFQDYLKYGNLKTEDLRDKNILELGPGDNLGVALLFLAYGAEKVVCFDRFYSERNTEKEYQIYQGLRNALTDSQKKNFDQAILFSPKSFVLNPQKLSYVLEDQLSKALPSNLRFDLIISRAVLEHILDIELLLKELHSRMKPGGMMLHDIDFRDHGMFSGCGQHPLRFLKIPSFFYKLMSSHSGHPNRKRLSFFSKDFRDKNYQLQIFVTEKLSPLHLESPFCPDLSAYTLEDLSTNTAFLVALKRE